MKKFLFWFAVAKRRQAETHQQNYQFSRSVRFSFRATTLSERGQSGFCSKKVRISTKRYRFFYKIW